MLEKRQSIMLVDDNMANLNVGKKILKDFYEVFALPSADRLFAFLEHTIPNLILLDVLMPGMNGFDTIRILKNNPRCADIPVIFVTSKTGEVDELEGLSLGAVDYVAKPFSAAILLKRIENTLLIEKQKAELKKFNVNLLQMVKEKMTQVFDFQNTIITTVADLVEFRDAFTGGHISRTQKYMKLLIDQLIEDAVYYNEILTWENTEYLLPSTQLHDLGKIGISDTILNKTDKLTTEEFEIMKTHVDKGVDAINHMGNVSEEWSFLKYAKIVAETHHEKWDGSGYPLGLKEQEIPLAGRLMAIADVYDALISTRPYKKPFTHKESARIILEGSGSHFDPILIDIFKKVEKEFALVADNRDSVVLDNVASLTL